MTIKEESSFLQGVESRLDSLFAEDTHPIQEKDSDPPQAIVQEVASDVKEDIREIPDIAETNLKAEASPDSIQTQDKSAFISEIEKRFSAIFGDDDKDVSAVKELEKPDDLKSIIAQAEPEQSKKSNQFFGDISLTPSSILYSPLKDMKGIILSIEWEISDQILEQLEDEISKLYMLYTGDRVIQGFLRILRFMGRYIRVRGVRSNQDSINLLLFVYDQLENVMVSEGMTETKKHVILIDSIKKYRAWVENTDIETPEETQLPETAAYEMKAHNVEPLADKFPGDHKIESEPFADIRVAEENPFAEAAIDKVADPESSVREPDEEDKSEFPIKDLDIIIPTPTPTDEISLPGNNEDVERVIAAIKDRPPHEAFVYALEELKKTFQSELDALKEEIRILKKAS